MGIKVREWMIKNRDNLISGVASTLIFTLFSYFVSWIPRFFSFDLNGLFGIVYAFLREILFFQIPLYSIVFFLLLIIFFRNVLRIMRVLRRNLQIIEALYFTNSYSLNITKELNNAVEDDKLKIILSNQIAGDPHYGVDKKGRVKYKFDNRQYEREYNENELIELP